MSPGALRRVRWVLLALLSSLLAREGVAKAQVPNIPVNVVTGAWVEGMAANRTVATFTDSGCAPGVIYSATITWGDGAVSRVGSGPGIFGSCSIGFTVAASHLYAEEGAYQLSVAVFGTDGSAGNGSAPNTVADAPLTPTAVARIEPPQMPFSVSVATFTDGDVFGTASDYTARIDWGDGSTSSGTIQPSAGTGFDVIGSHTYAAPGSYSVPVTVRDAGGASTAVTSLMLVGAVIIANGDTIRSTEGQPFSGEVATFADTQCGSSVTYNVSIDWGDGATGAGSVSGSCNGGFAVRGTHSYTEGGSYALQIAISGSNGSGGRATGTAIVADAPLTGAGTTLRVTLGTPFTGVVGTFTDAGPNGGAADYTAAVDWGDGSAGSAGVVGGGAGGAPFTVTGSHTYFTTGAKRISVTVTDRGGAITTIVSTANVGASVLSVVAGSLTALEGMPAQLTGGSFTDAGCSPATDTYVITIDWGDGTPVSSLSSGPGTSCNTGQPVVAGHTYARAGTASIAVTVASPTNGRGGRGTGLAAIAGAAIGPGAPVTLALDEGQSFSGTVATFSDANAAARPGDFTASIDWGDGSPKSVGVVATTGGGFSVTGAHLYTEQGSFALMVTITTADGRAIVSSGKVMVAEVAVVIATPTISATAGATFSGLVTTFVDPGHPAGFNADLPMEFTATIDWGDGSTSAGMVALVSGNTYSVSGIHIYQREGMAAVVVTVSHNGTATSGTGTATIGATASFVVLDGEFDGATATFTDTDPLSAAADFAATIEWGDGTRSRGVVSGPDGGLFTVDGSHTYKADGDYSIATTIRKVGGETRLARLAVTVKAEMRKPRRPRRGLNPPGANGPRSRDVAAIGASGLDAVEGETFERTIVAFVDDACGAATYRATIAWGDGKESRGNVLAAGACIFFVSGKHKYADAGDYSIAVAIHGSNGHKDGIELAMAVDDAPLTAWAATIWTSSGTRLGETAVAYFHDADPGGALSNYSATVAWSDGAGTANAAIERHPPFGGCTHPCFAVTARHVYSAEGTFAVAVTVTDAGGAAAAVTSTVIVFGGTTVGSRTVPTDAPGMRSADQAISAGSGARRGRPWPHVGRGRGARLNRRSRSSSGRRTQTHGSPAVRRSRWAPSGRRSIRPSAVPDPGRSARWRSPPTGD